MILNVTNEQKKLIESQGYMVVEFKLWLKRFVELYGESFIRVSNEFRLICVFLNRMAIKSSLEQLKEKFQEISESFSDFSKVILFDETPKYPFVRELGNKNYRCFVQRKKIRRARSCC